MALMLEVLDARGNVRTRVRVQSLPVHIGRALDNDVILDDPYVDAQHARIRTDESGAVIVEDLGSINGIVDVRAGNGPGARGGRVNVAPGVELRIGRTLVRLRDAHEPVPPALADRVNAPGLVPRWATTVRAQLLLCVVALFAMGADTWLGSYDRAAAEETFQMVIGIALAGALWAGIWAVAGRIVVHRFHFLAHCALLSVLLLALWGWIELVEWLGFVFPDNRAVTVASTAFMLVFVAILVAGHLGLASALSIRRRIQAGAVTSAVLLGLMGVGALTANDAFSDVPEFAVTVKAVGTRWLPTRTVAEFGETTSTLKDEIDKLAR